jgi:hypothetical protein
MGRLDGREAGEEALMSRFHTVPVYPRGGFYGVKGVPIENGAPPSTYAVAAFINGEPGSFARLVGVTVLRAVFIVPSLWLSAKIVPGVKIGLVPSLLMGVAASAGISTGLVGWYWLKTKAGQMARAYA